MPLHKVVCEVGHITYQVILRPCCMVSTKVSVEGKVLDICAAPFKSVQELKGHK